MYVYLNIYSKVTQFIAVTPVIRSIGIDNIRMVLL